MTGARAGRAIEHRKSHVRDAEVLIMAEGSIRPTDMARGAGIPRCRRTQARTYALRRDLGGLHAIPPVVGGVAEERRKSVTDDERHGEI